MIRRCHGGQRKLVAMELAWKQEEQKTQQELESWRLRSLVPGRWRNRLRLSGLGIINSRKDVLRQNPTSKSL